MSVTVTNLAQGPGTLYTGAFGAAEPADSAVNTTPAASAWTDRGGTDGGVKLVMTQTFSELKVDQIVDSPGRRLVKRDFNIQTNLAEVTLENLALAMNGGTAASGSGFKTLTPETASSATQPNYIGAILDGWAPNQKRRRVIARKVLNISNVESAYQKDAQTFVPVDFAAHYVSNVIAPFYIQDEVAA
jgi:hypothetical protein